MAYDPNDPADKAILDAAVKAERDRLTEEHENDVQGLKDKVAELNTKLRKARTEGGNENAGEIERLENDLVQANNKLRDTEKNLREANRNLESVTTERDSAVTERDGERKRANDEFVSNRLTAEFGTVNVAEHFRTDLVGAMANQVTVKEVDGERKAFVGDKALGDFIKEWSESDKGKHYVLAPNNTGGQAPGGGGGQGPNGAKKISQMNYAERAAHFNAIGETAFNTQVEAEKAAA